MTGHQGDHQEVTPVWTENQQAGVACWSEGGRWLLLKGTGGSVESDDAQPSRLETQDLSWNDRPALSTGSQTEFTFQKDGPLSFVGTWLSLEQGRLSLLLYCSRSAGGSRPLPVVA